MSVKNISVDDMSRVTYIIPENVKAAIADVVIQFARMEAAAEDLIWQICGLSFENGSLLTTMDARPKFELAKTLTARERITLTPPLPPTFWETTQDLRTHRNSVAHGLWSMVDGAIPVSASFRDKDQQGKRIMGNAFPIDRLEAIARQCERCRTYLERLKEAHQTPRPKALRQRRDRS